MSRRPYRSERYLRFIRSLCCVVCGARKGIEASHTGLHGLGQRADDTDAIPLCVRHHRIGPQSYHRLGRRRFEQYHGLDIAAIIRKLNEKPRNKIEDGWYVAYIARERYQLAELEAGIDNALRKLAQIRHERLTDKIEENLHA